MCVADGVIARKNSIYIIYRAVINVEKCTLHISFGWMFAVAVAVSVAWAHCFFPTKIYFYSHHFGWLRANLLLILVMNDTQ